MSSAAEHSVKVSVLMPTYRQVDFIARAINSLLAQTLVEWELLVVDDGSPDDTEKIVRSFTDPRIRYFKFSENRGLGAVLNWSLTHAAGKFIAYLPSDDYFDPTHLSDCVDLLETNENTYAAYSGVRWWEMRASDVFSSAGNPLLRQRVETPTLRGADAVSRERELLLADSTGLESDLMSGNIFALVQVVHRRSLESRVKWISRSEMVTDGVELEYWRGLVQCGADFTYTGKTGGEWSDHPDQMHKIIAGRRYADPTDRGGEAYGIARYRQHYGIEPTEYLNWQSSRLSRDERAMVHGILVAARERNQSAGRQFGERAEESSDHRPLKILVVGRTSHNPDRLCALKSYGHKMYELSLPYPAGRPSTYALPYVPDETIPFDKDWKDKVLEAAPEIILGMQNWNSISICHQILDSKIEIPFVFHYKESPHHAMVMGLWPKLRRLVTDSAGVILINDESRDWFELATGKDLHADRVLILDGDMPNGLWASENWTPKLSAEDGEIHTVCLGRVNVDGRVIFENVAEFAQRGIHIHVYDEGLKWSALDWVKTGIDSKYLHIHEPVERYDWVRCLSRYDAGWTYGHKSTNSGHIMRAHWDDLNLPARLGTYAVAGLPWIIRDNTGHRVAVQNVAETHGIGIMYSDLDELASKLRDGEEMLRLSQRMRRSRNSFCFDSQVNRLTEFFHKLL
jgi:glycosyltransferase involved in cell wall biosynthesis